MDYAKLDRAMWRPIVFEGVSFPPTLMGISILAAILDGVENDVHAWLLALSTCRGVTKAASSIDCFRHSQRASDLMLEQRTEILKGIASHLGPYHFDPAATYRDWITALQQISEIAARTEDDCEWSAPAFAGEAPIVSKQIEAMRRYLDGAP